MGLENELFLPKRFGAISLPAYGLSSYPLVSLPFPADSCLPHASPEQASSSLVGTQSLHLTLY